MIDDRKKKKNPVVQGEDFKFNEDNRHSAQESSEEKKPMGKGDNRTTQLITGLGSKLPSLDALGREAELRNVKPEAIKQYTKTIGDFFHIPTQYQPFFAYFYEPNHNTLGSMNFYRINCAEKMSREEFAEAGRVVFGDIITKTDVGTKLFKTGEDLITIPKQFLPEDNVIDEIIQDKAGNYYEYVAKNPYFNLINMGARGKTFFAGLLYELKHKAPTQRAAIKYKMKDKTIPVTTKQIMDYGLSIGVNNISKYLKQLEQY